MYQFKEIKCPICEDAAVRVLGIRAPLSFPGKEARVVRCMTCGLVYANPMPFPDDGQTQMNFKDVDSYFPENTDRRSEFLDTILMNMERYSRGKGRFLDVGCGRGELVFSAQKRGWDAVGMDVSEGFVRYARDRYHVDARAGRLEDMKIQGESFDAVSMISVLQCCHNPIVILQEIHRILKMGGILALETTNYDALLYILGDLFYRIMGQKKTTRLSPLSPGYEVFGFSPYSLKKILIKTGFELLGVQIGGNISGGKGFKIVDLKTAAVYVLRYGALLLGIAMGKGQVINAWARKI